LDGINRLGAERIDRQRQVDLSGASGLVDAGDRGVADVRKIIQLGCIVVQNRSG